MATPDNGHRPPSLSFLLRLWVSAVRGKLIWRASLEDPRTRHRVGFLSLDELAGYLSERTEALEERAGQEEVNDPVMDQNGKAGEGREREKDPS